MENLLRQRETLLNQIRELDDIPKPDAEKIHQAIQSQRWFFFSNNDKILFDKATALIWANLKYFPYGKNNNSESYSGDEVKNLILTTNAQNFGNFNDWRPPYNYELWKMIEDKTFPFQQGANRRIKSQYRWCVYYESSLKGKDLDDGSILNHNFFYFIPCSSALVSKNFSAMPQEILDIFTKNNLIPEFNNETINQLYKKIYGAKDVANRQQILNRIVELDQKISAKKKLTAKIDYRLLLEQFDMAAIAKSPIKYFDAVLSLTDELLDVLQKYEAAQSETIAEFLKIALKLNMKYIDSLHLTTEENSLLAERQKFLAQRLELATDEPKRKILSVKAQAEKFFERLDKINSGDDSIRKLAALQAEPRADFELLAENLARIILDTQNKVDFFAANKDFVSNVVEVQSAWSDDYKTFKTGKREELKSICAKESIDDEIFAAWYDDWREKRFVIEEKFLPLVKFALDGHFLNAVYDILGNLQVYRDSVDKFYLHERKNIYQKFAFQTNGDLQEKFETESTLYKLAEKLQRDLQAIIFSCDKTEERVFLLKWSETFLNLPLDELSNFINDRELKSISEKSLTQFAELRQQNFATYLSDGKAYGEAIQRREQDYIALIFRMRKDLHKA